jgi:hypothetical protein
MLRTIHLHGDSQCFSADVEQRARLLRNDLLKCIIIVVTILQGNNKGLGFNFL